MTPRLLILSPVSRADLESYLSYFSRLEVWHVYRTRLSDTGNTPPGPRAYRATGLLNPLFRTLAIRPDIIQGAEPYYLPWGPYLCLCAAIAAMILGVPLYFPMFENIPPEVRFRRSKLGVPVGWLAVPLLKRFARWYARRAAVVFALNEGAVRNLYELGVSRTRVVRALYGTWGVDSAHFTPDRDGSEPDLGTAAVLFIGRLVPEKGIAYLLEAFRQVHVRLPASRLYLIGDGPMAGEVSAFALRHGLTDAITLLGVIPNSELPRYIRAARVVAAPSIATDGWAEQVGMVNIQSISCGTPVVTTYSGSIPEFIDDGVTGLLVKERDAVELALAVETLLTDDSLRNRLARSGRLVSKQRYDARLNVEKAEQVIVDCLSRQTYNRRTHRDKSEVR